MLYVCSNCDAQFAKWSGRCLECGKWGTLQETDVAPATAKISGKKTVSASRPAQIATLSELASANLQRHTAAEYPAGALFPQGIVAGSITLLSGEPGAGKSTLALQLAKNFSSLVRVLYCSAEESAVQLRERGQRLGAAGAQLFIAESSQLEEITATVVAHKPQVVIVDSIQTITSQESASELGSINQIKIVTSSLSQLAKTEQVAIIVIGHVTKEGTVAGPKTLEHLVDAVYFLEADRRSPYRLLRCFKNRYGAAGTVQVMQLTSSGLKEVKDAATIFIHDYQAKPGSVVTLTRVEDQLFFVEVQALVSKSAFGYAKRTSSGFSKSRLELLLAIMKKHLHVDCDAYDVYVNLAGGFKVNEPAMDLAVVLAIISSLKDESLPKGAVAFGEVGLSGELRVVRDTAARLTQAEKHKFTLALVPPLSGKLQSKLRVEALGTIQDVIKHLKW